MQKLCRLLAQVPSLEITGFIPYPSNLLQNPSKPHPANTATLWGTHLLNLLKLFGKPDSSAPIQRTEEGCI